MGYAPREQALDKDQSSCAITGKSTSTTKKGLKDEGREPQGKLDENKKATCLHEGGAPAKLGKY